MTEPGRVIPLRDALRAGPPPPGNLAVPLLSRATADVELYQPIGADTQTPHTRDEVYVVARGTSRFWDGGAVHDLVPGDLVFVPAHTPHRFEDFSEDFAVWVLFFGPARAG